MAATASTPPRYSLHVSALIESMHARAASASYAARVAPTDALMPSPVMRPRRSVTHSSKVAGGRPNGANSSRSSVVSQQSKARSQAIVIASASNCAGSTSDGPHAEARSANARDVEDEDLRILLRRFGPRRGDRKRVVARTRISQFGPA
ncbi:hypothetical protein DB32_007359 [Sandaracinus amylolyticus]|uniref:Uncharacterized protein n=1 Tax=Sandaracinus amylolyticus TaxID=927083 RepID=A0A0F6YLR9_9BACT|nr:hypothetical protein DB32_007359 [Sandaracinus amylolyticus]